MLVKIGGSLLDLQDLRLRLLALPELLDAEICYVVGGGEAANVVRSLQQTHALSDAAAHGVAVGTMDLNGELVERLLAGAGDPPDELTRVPVRRSLDLVTTVGDETSEPPGLPANWDVTSDSIAAVLAKARNLPLVLLKSVAPPQSIDVAVAREMVDPFFPTASEGLDVNWLNLRTFDPVLVQMA